MEIDLKESDLKTTLRLFREFVQHNATQWKAGSQHHHPMWARVAAALEEDNNLGLTGDEWRFIQAGLEPDYPQRNSGD